MLFAAKSCETPLALPTTAVVKVFVSLYGSFNTIAEGTGAAIRGMILSDGALPLRGIRRRDRLWVVLKDP